MTSEDIAIVRKAFAWRPSANAFLADSISVLALDTASIQRLTEMAKEGIFQQIKPFSFRMLSKSENLFWSKTELDEVHPVIKESSDFAAYAAMISLASRELAENAVEAVYAGSVWEMCGFLDDLCSSATDWEAEKQNILDRLPDLNADEGTAFKLAGENLSVIFDCTVEMGSNKMGKLWLRWEVDENCLFQKDEAQREKDRQESRMEAVRRIVAVGVNRNEMAHLAFAPRKNA